MKTCSLNDFMQGLKPWLSSEYIRKAYVDEQGHFVINFVDGVKNVYRIDDCTFAQLKDILKDFKAKGIYVDS
ncbi:MAG: hypothetical protein ACQERN_07485 [Thermodesulfobacteriota bacterium]